MQRPEYDKSALQWNQFVKDFFADEMIREILMKAQEWRDS